VTIERLNRLFFELSSPERIDMMLELKKKSLKLSGVSRKMDLTVTESSRHLQRLREAKLIQKDTEGYFSVSPFGDLILSLISPLNFVTKNQKYFLEYDISPLPCEFVSRMGELLEGEIGGDIFSNLEYLEQELRKADKFIWIQTDQIFKNLIPIVAEKIEQPFDFRFISPQEVMPPDSKAPLPSTTPNVKKRSLPKVDIVIVVTEKTAGFCLPDRNGKLDYRNLHGNDPKFLKWCQDLFLHYWERAKPVNQCK
jgi:predicted transcriptional regulator